MSQQGRV